MQMDCGYRLMCIAIKFSSSEWRREKKNHHKTRRQYNPDHKLSGIFIQFYWFSTCLRINRQERTTKKNIFSTL